MTAGRVVYIHPEGRFYTLEFEFRRFDQVARFRESFFPVLVPDPEPPAPPGRHYGAGGKTDPRERKKPGKYVNLF